MDVEVGDAAWLRNIRARYSDVTARSPHVYRDVVRLLGLLDDAHANGRREGLRQAAAQARASAQGFRALAKGGVPVSVAHDALEIAEVLEDFADDLHRRATTARDGRGVRMDTQQELNQALNCLFIAVDEAVAQDVQEKVRAGIADAHATGLREGLRQAAAFVRNQAAGLTGGLSALGLVSIADELDVIAGPETDAAPTEMARG